MKNKLLIVVLLLSILLSGCGNSGDSSPVAVDNSDAWEDNSEYEEMDMDYEEDTYEETEEVVVTYPLTELTPFSEDRAWVKYDKDGIIYTGIIDTDGNVLYETEEDFYYKSQFQDGTAFYRKNKEVTSPCGIIDLDGNVLFDSQITSDGGYLILGYGEGHFFAAQHIENFDVNEWRYGTLDKNGNILHEMRQFTFEDNSCLGAPKANYETEYIGENYIRFEAISNNYSNEFYNLSTAEIVVPGSNYEPVTEFHEGYALCEAYYMIYGDIIMNVSEWLDSLKYDMDLWEENPYYNRGIENIYDSFGWKDGLILASPCLLHGDQTEPTDYGYYDKDWNLVVSLEKYRDKDIEGGPFGSEYAAVTLRGSDGCHYASAIDRSGDLVYDPVKIDDGELHDSANGYFQVIIDGEGKIISPDGTTYTLGIDDLSMLEGLTFGDISNGFIIMGSEGDSSGISPCYISLDANTIIDSVKVTSTDIDANEDESWGDETSEDTSYIVPDSYDITGKWKSIGDNGFGQAQPGAIVIFDGNRCNFYSPNDTYAFYKEDDRYVLDITSVLGESLSQTVNIIDDDNIEIAGASLKRME